MLIWKEILKIAVFVVSCLMFVLASSAMAQLATTFELDGNAIEEGAVPGEDWDVVNSTGGSSEVHTGVLVDPSDSTRFTEGSKDVLDLDEWGWDNQSSPPKDQITNAYAALYAGNLLYFGADRYATNGDAQIGFWLFKNPVSLITVDGKGRFDGLHAIGDILILSDFIRGGTVPYIKVFMWVGSGGTHGSLDSIPVDPSSAFAIVNSGSTPSPWPYEPKKGSTDIFPENAFFEGGLDLGALGIEGCFSEFLVETRSSQSVNAELKDFAMGSFPANPQVTVNDDTVCEGLSGHLCATVSGGASPFTYSWSGPAGFSAYTECIDPTVAGTYTVTVTSLNGCEGQGSGTLVITTEPICDIAGDDTICAGTTSEFCAPAGMSSYSWSGPGGFSATTQCTGPIGTLGYYTVTIVDPYGCENTCTKKLYLYRPTCEITGADTVCEGSTTEFCAPAGMSDYLWDGPEGFSATTQCTGPIGVAGIYQLRITDTEGCQSWCQKELYVKSCALGKQGVSAIALPQEFSVSQNYPNPFNPTCVIAYALPSDCQVKLSIYNILGQKVKVLVDEYQNAGYRSVTWDGKDAKGQEVSAGVYFYRIEAGNFEKSMKMVFAK